MTFRSAGTVALAITVLLVPAGLTAEAAAAAPPSPTIRVTPNGLQYQATDESAHVTSLTATDDTVTLTESGPSRFDPQQVPRQCRVQTAAEGGVAATCPLRGRTSVTVRYGTGDDFLDGSELPARVALDVRTGEGLNAVEAGSGPDTITAGSADDTLYGGPGADVIRAGDGFNFIHGNSGADVITSGGGMDFVFGDASDDLISTGDDLAYAYGGGGDDALVGGRDNDTLSGGSGTDLLDGLGGADELNGGSGTDLLLGGPGDDLLRLRDDGTADTARCGAGSDVARVDAGSVDRVDRSCEAMVAYDPAVADPEDENDVLDESVEEAVDAVDLHAGFPKGWHRHLWGLNGGHA